MHFSLARSKHRDEEWIEDGEGGRGRKRRRDSKKGGRSRQERRRRARRPPRAGEKPAEREVPETGRGGMKNRVRKRLR